MKLTKLQKSLIAIGAITITLTACANYTLNTMGSLFEPKGCQGVCSVESKGKVVEGVQSVYRIGDKLITKDSDIYMVKYDGNYTIESSEKFRNELDDIAKVIDSDDVLIVNIESLGGTVEACETDHHIIRQISEETKAYIVTIVDNYADSCGYYALSSGDYIYASKGANVGNIGVTYNMSTRPAELIMNKLGGKIKHVSSTEIKKTFAGGDVEESLKEEIITVAMTKAYDRFTGDILAQRGDRIKDKELAFSGYPLSSREAYQIGLVDGLKDTRTLKRELYKLGYDINIVSTNSPSSMADTISEMSAGAIKGAMSELK